MRPTDETRIDGSVPVGASEAPAERSLGIARETNGVANDFRIDAPGREPATDAITPGYRSGARERPPGVVETGTTVVGAAGADGLVLAGDTRASLGGRFVANRTVRKVEPVGERIAVAFSGSVSDARAFVRRLRSETRLYEMRRGGPPSVSTTATVAGDLVRRGPYRRLDLVLAGVDEEPAVYDIGPGGGVMRTDYAASGSGMQLAYGALEGSYDPDRPVSALRDDVAAAVLSAAERDTASGDGMTIATIAGDGLEIERFEDLEAVAGSIDAPDDIADGEEVA